MILIYRNRVEDTLKCMREKASEDNSALQYYVDDYSLNYFPFVVMVDENFLPISPRTIMENQDFKDISVLIGSNANEGRDITVLKQVLSRFLHNSNLFSVKFYLLQCNMTFIVIA